MKSLIIFVSVLIISISACSQNICKVWSYVSFRNGDRKFFEVEWTGDSRGGKADGYGTAYFTDGSRFTGTMIRGVPQGTGKFMVRNSGGDYNNYLIIISDWVDGRENGSTVNMFLPAPNLGYGYTLSYMAGQASAGNYIGTWYGYDQNGKNIGWMSKENGRYIVHHQSIDLSSIVGILAGLGVGLVGLAAVAAASTPAEVFLLIIIF